MGVPPHWGWSLGMGLCPLDLEKVLNFVSSKNAGFYAFLLRKTACGQKPGPEGLMDPLWAENLARVQLPPPVTSHPNVTQRLQRE